MFRLEISNIGDKSSCECKKVVSDISGEIEFFADLKGASKMTYFKL